jgi:hypothetical protein
MSTLGQQKAAPNPGLERNANDPLLSFLAPLYV